MATYATFAMFRIEQEAQLLIALLVENDIPYLIEEDQHMIDPLIIGELNNAAVSVKIPINYFNKANRLTGQATGGQSGHVPQRIRNSWIIIGYLSVLMPFAGAFCGLSIISSFARSRNGRKVRTYDAYSNRHGLIIMIAGILSSVVFLGYSIIRRLQITS